VCLDNLVVERRTRDREVVCTNLTRCVVEHTAPGKLLTYTYLFHQAVYFVLEGDGDVPSFQSYEGNHSLSSHWSCLTDFVVCVGGVAQWLGRRSLAGGLSLIYG